MGRKWVYGIGGISILNRKWVYRIGILIGIYILSV
jgi:hypothetical protein